MKKIMNFPGIWLTLGGFALVCFILMLVYAGIADKAKFFNVCSLHIMNHVKSESAASKNPGFGFFSS